MILIACFQINTVLLNYKVRHDCTSDSFIKDGTEIGKWYKEKREECVATIQLSNLDNLLHN